MDDDITENLGSEEPDLEWVVNQIAHALRNPIFAALVQIEALTLRGGPGAGSNKAADSVLKQLKRLEQTVNEMLLFGRPATLSREPVNVSKLVSSVADAYRRGDREEPAEVTVTVADSQLEARWDEAAVRTILQRLMDNAVQQSEPPHCIEIRVTGCADREVTISITDDGYGIAEDLADQIFLPFFPQHRGRPGLGLAVALKFTKLLGGRLMVTSRPERGAEATLVLPLDGDE